MGIIVDFAKADDLEGVVELDRNCFGDEGVIELEELRKWFNKNKYQLMVAKDGDTVVGALGIWHLKLEAYERLINQGMSEHDFTADDFMEFKSGNRINCYFSIAVLNNTTSIAVRLISYLKTYFKILKENNMSIEKLCAIGFTINGIKLCRKLGFKEIHTYKNLSNGIEPILFIKDLRKEDGLRISHTIKGLFMEDNQAI